MPPRQQKPVKTEKSRSAENTESRSSGLERGQGDGRIPRARTFVSSWICSEDRRRARRNLIAPCAYVTDSQPARTSPTRRAAGCRWGWRRISPGFDVVVPSRMRLRQRALIRVSRPQPRAYTDQGEHVETAHSRTSGGPDVGRVCVPTEVGDVGPPRQVPEHLERQRVS